MFGIEDNAGNYGVASALLGTDPRSAAARAVRQALEAAGRPGEIPAFVWLNGTPGSEEDVLLGIEDVLGSNVPIYGGSAGANDSPRRSAPNVFSDERVPTAIATWFEPGHDVLAGQRTCVRFSTSSTSIVTAFFSRAELSGGNTTTALLRSSAPAEESPATKMKRVRTLELMLNPQT